MIQSKQLEYQKELKNEEQSTEIKKGRSLSSSNLKI